jgi:hypothetical protein
MQKRAVIVQNIDIQKSVTCTVTIHYIDVPDATFRLLKAIEMLIEIQIPQKLEGGLT